MKTLGIDYGSVRTGIAISDPSGSVAMPYKTVPTNDLFTYIASILASEEIVKIIFGKSLNLDGKENQIQAQIQQFADRLEKELSVETDYFDERFTSMAARTGTAKPIRRDTKRHNIKGSAKNILKNQAVDAAAAAMILQSYLDNQLQKNQKKDQS